MAARCLQARATTTGNRTEKEVTVTSQTTEPVEYAEPAISRELSAFDALASLARMFPALPGGYVVVHAPMRYAPAPRIGLQLDTPQAFEQWRAALQIAPADIDLLSNSHGAWLAATAVFHGIEMRVTGHAVPLSHDVASTRQQQDATVTA